MIMEPRLTLGHVREVAKERYKPTQSCGMLTKMIREALEQAFVEGAMYAGVKE